MRFKIWLTLALAFILTCESFSQDSNTYKWWNPVDADFPVLEGQVWPKEVKNRYDRFPARAEKSLDPAVWNLSHNSAGLSLRFETNAGDIVVRYVVQNKGKFAMPHMPATGVSGIDLYAKDHSGKWVWAPGKYSFGDTIQYRFSNLEVDHEFKGRANEFTLFLPLYNTVQWMEIGVPDKNNFTPLPLRTENPVVVYGTSIAQGGCASRPGLAWTAILERSLDRPLINLGFSGNGKLDTAVIDLMNEIDAKIYVLDCLPNLTGFAADEVDKRIRASVNLLQQKHPAIPILLVEHSGGNNRSVIDTSRYHAFEKVNIVLRKSFASLKAAGIKNIYLLTNQEINLDINSTVDGVHPNDIGMEKHAMAYEKTIRTILNEPKGEIATTIPVTQSRDGNYDWQKRHEEVLLLNKRPPPANVIIANSIIHYWGGKPEAPIARGKDSWSKYLEPLNVRNLGYGWDRIENALYRVYHGELDGYDAKHITVMIGTNNLGVNSDDEIIEGLQLLLNAIKNRQPKAIILLSGIFPRRDMEKRIVTLNNRIAKLTNLVQVRYINPGKTLLRNDGKIDERFFTDGLHPNEVGYQKLGTLMETYLK